jgi:hypothetical protein
MSFIDTIKSNLTDKGLSDSSIKLYINNLIKLNNGEHFKNFKFLEDIDSIKSKIADFKPTTQKGYITTIISTLSTFDNKKLKTLQNKYYEFLKGKVNEINEYKGQKSESQKENWTSWDDILQTQKQLHEIVMKFIDNKKLNVNQYNVLLGFVILSLYTLQPPRRNLDYSFMNIVKGEPKDKDKNYIITDKKQFEFNVFKTAKEQSGEHSNFDINEQLQHIIFDMYFKHHPNMPKKITTKTNIPFLVDFKGEQFKSTNAITRILNHIFDKNIGVSMLRNIYLTDKYKSVEKEREQDAEAMAHSVNTQKSYIKTD